MNQPSTNGARPRKPVSVLEKVFSFSTTAAFVFVAFWIDQPVFFVAAAFAAVTAVAALFARRYPREARVAGWVGRIGTIITLVVVTVLLISGQISIG